MTEAKIDEYFQKLLELDNICENPLTTPEQLLTYFAQLDTIENELDTEIENMVSIPSTTIHFRKFILSEIERSDNSKIQSNLLSLIELKQNYADEYAKLQYPEDTNFNQEEKNQFCKDYQTEIINIKNTINGIISSCNCMKNRKTIIEKNNKI